MSSLKRKLEIVFLVLVIGAGAAGLFLFLGPQPRNSELVFIQKTGAGFSQIREISVRNVTDRDILYWIAPRVPVRAPLERTIRQGAVDRFRTTMILEITFKRGSRRVTRNLEPGNPYSFRYDENDNIQIYPGSHGKSHLPDLAPFVPTPPAVVDKMLETAGVRADDVVFDLGCGDGRIVIAAARDRGARGVGIDLDAGLIREARERAKVCGVEDRVEFILQDVMKADLSAATVVALYLLPESNELLRPKLERELVAGTRVVSHDYHIPGWEGREMESVIVEDEGGRPHTVFFYRK